MTGLLLETLIELLRAIGLAWAARRIDSFIDKAGTRLRNIGRLRITESFTEIKTFYQFEVDMRDYIIEHSTGNRVLPNKWAYVVNEAVFIYERFLRENLSEMYDGSLSLKAQRFCAGIRDKNISTFFIYGHGNLKREVLLIDELTRESNRRKKIFMYDCSPFYSSIATSPEFSPIWNVIGRISDAKAVCIDIESEYGQRIIARDRQEVERLHTGPVLHMFLGNFAGNVEEGEFRDILVAVTEPGDFVLVEHAEYGEEYFDLEEEDYTNEMAITAASRLFDVPEKAVTAVTKCTKSPPNSAKFVEISLVAKINERDTSVRFCSMMRRNFDISEIHTDNFRHTDNFSLKAEIEEFSVPGGKVWLRLFRRELTEKGGA